MATNFFRSLAVRLPHDSCGELFRHGNVQFYIVFSKHYSYAHSNKRRDDSNGNGNEYKRVHMVYELG